MYDIPMNQDSKYQIDTVEDDAKDTDGPSGEKTQRCGPEER